MNAYNLLKAHIMSSPQFYLLSIALVLHLASMAFMNQDPLRADAIQFNNEAINIVEGRGLINTEGAGYSTGTYPTQVVFLVICKIIFGTHNYFVPVLLQHLMMAISVILLFRICRCINLSLRVSLLSGIILILFHNLYKSASVLNTQTLGYFLPVLFFYICVKYRKIALAIFAGFLLGTAILARFTYQYVPIALALCAVLFRKSKDYPILLKGYRYIPVLVACGLTILPWFYWVGSKEGGTSGYTNAWYNMYAFNSVPDRDLEAARSLIARNITDNYVTKSEQEAYLRQLTFELLKQNPENFLKNAMTNTTAMLVNLTWEESSIVNPYTAMYYSILLGYGILGLFVLRKFQHIKLIPLYFISVIVYAVHTVVYGYMAHFYIFWFAIIPSISSGIVISIKSVQLRRKGIITV